VGREELTRRHGDHGITQRIIQITNHKKQIYHGGTENTEENREKFKSQITKKQPLRHAEHEVTLRKT